MGVFLCIVLGFEPERVAALSKQSSGLFVAGESLSDSESQIVFAVGKDGKSLNLRQEKHSHQ